MIDNRIPYQQCPIIPINTIATKVKQSSSINQKANGVSFSKLLMNETSGVKFSQHALQRMSSRNVELSQNELIKLCNAVDKAAQKGAKESLIIINNDIALVVSIKNKTVITAMDGASLKDNVFTNIDSAVIV